MNLQGRNLSMDMRGDDVSLLQKELRQLGFIIPDSELLEAQFGEGTRNAVSKFQETNQLRPTGEVDERTAKSINTRVDESRPSPAPDTRTPFIVRGLVSSPGGIPSEGVVVRAFDKDMRGAELIGEARTKAGRYEISYGVEKFDTAEKGSADLIVRAYDDNDKEIASSFPLIIFNAQPVETVDLSLVGEGRSPSEYERLIAELTPLLQSVPLREVTETDIDFLVGDTGIDRQRIAWLVQAAQLASESLSPTNIALGTASPALMPASQISIPVAVLYAWFRQNLPTDLVELLRLDKDLLRAALERSIRDNIVPPLTGDELNDTVHKLRAQQAALTLKPADRDEPASLGDLLKTTQLSSDRQLTIAALQVEYDGASHEFWKALNEREDFNEKEIKSVRLTLQLRDLTGNHLPLIAELQRLTSTLEPGDDGLRALAKLDIADWRAILLHPQADGQPIGAPPTIPGADLKERVNNYATTLNQYLENSQPTPVIASRLANDISSDSPFKSARADLKTFFSNNPSFEFKTTPVDLYLSDGRDEKFRNVKDPAALVSELKKMQRVFNITPRYPEMRALLADDLHSALAIVSVGKRRFTEKYAEPFGGPSQATDVYRKAEQVNATALALYMKHARAFNNPLPYAIAGDATAAPVALSLRSANLPDLSSLFGSLDLCDCEHCKSLYSPAAYFVDILRFLNDGPTKEGMNPLEVLLNRRPDLEHIELTCENTNTELPYVDLVKEILEARIVPRVFVIPEGTNINSVLGDLNTPKLPVSFSTAFANKGYPLTDKASVRVDETERVASGSRWMILDSGWAFEVAHQGTNEGFRVLAWPQTSWTSDELRATPEHPHDPAYTVLLRAVYPWNLPLNLPVAEMRVYLNNLGVARHALIETFFRDPVSDVLSDENIAHEYLGLTNEEADIITGVTTGAAAGTIPTPGAWNFWGLQQTGNDIVDPTDGTAPHATGDWDVVLKRVSIFLQQSGLRYEELLELLGTYFINPPAANGRTIGIASIDPLEAATCTLSKLEIQVVDKTIPATVQKDQLIGLWNKAHRFVRLWRTLGWTMRDLDKAITALEPTNTSGKVDLTEDFLTQLSHIQRLRTEVRLPVVNLLSWWANIDTRSYVDHLADGEPAVPSLYAALFNNRSAAGQSLAEDPATLGGKLSENASIVSAALQISTGDFTLLRTDTNVIPHLTVAGQNVPDDNLSLVNLSLLYSHALLARSLKYSISTYLSTLELVSNAPFNTTADTVRFIQHIDNLRASAFRVEELDYLLRHRFQASSTLAVSDDEIAVILDSIREDLRKVSAENTFVEATSGADAATDDPNGDLTRRKLALLNWDTALIDEVIAVLNGTFTFEAELGVLAPGILIPEPLKNKVSYNEVAKQLRFNGNMTLAERTQLTGLQNADNSFKTAVQVLFDGPKSIVSRYMCRFSVPRTQASLDPLPANLKFPDALKSKIYYDTVEKKLRFVGVMTESERTVLLKLSADTAYVAAIEALFVAPANSAPLPADTFLTTSGTNNDAASLFDDPNTTPQARFLLVLRKLFPYLRSTLSERAVVQRLSEYLQLDSSATNALLTEWINSPAHPTRKAIADFLDSGFSESNPNVDSSRDAFPDQFKTYSLLYKVAMLSRKFKLTTRQLEWLFEFGPGNGWLDLGGLPLEPITTAQSLYMGWERLVDLFKLRDALPLGETLLTDIFTTARDAGTQPDALLENLSKGTQWEIGNLQALSGTGGFNFPVSAYKDEVAMLRLSAAFAMMKQLGASADQCLSWTEPSMSDTDAANCARDIKSLVRARLDLGEWFEVAKTLHDPLRERQRSALVSYLVAEKAVRDSNDLYDDFLIDVEMSPCMMTTRIKQAISSVQLFIQRSLMNLESDVSLSPQEAQEWTKWRKQYRVWEANRKVLLYPENWIEPQLRDDKSSFFKDLENELLQNDITVDTAETAFLHYLEKVNEVARLEIVGLYHQQEPATDSAGDPVDIVHVFGRTFSTPHVYYYRCRTGTDPGTWTAWEKVEVDIQGDHLIPLIWNRRLYLFWATFTSKQKDAPLTMPEAGKSMAVGKTWEIHLAWSEYKNGKWSHKKQSKPYVSGANHPDVTADSEFSFKSRVVSNFSGDEQLFLDCYGPVALTIAGTSSSVTKETFLFSLDKQPNPQASGKENPADAASVLLKLNGNQFPATAVNNVEIVVRRNSNGQELDRLPAMDDWNDLINGDLPAVKKDYFLSSAVYEVVLPITKESKKRKITQVLAAGGHSDSQVEEETLADAYTVNLKSTTTSPVSSTEIMQLVSFPFDDGQGNIGTPFVFSSPTTRLQPLVGTRFVDMTMVEVEDQNLSNALGNSKLLGRTPGIFRLLVPHQTYVPTILSLPFFYQDESHTYLVSAIPVTNGQVTYKYRFSTFYHPAVRPFIKALNRFGINGLLTLNNQRLIDVPIAFDEYQPNTLVDSRFPREDVDFSQEGAYSIYNWELFFHVPFLIATQLSNNQRFEEAHNWFRYIFDPTATDSPDKSENPGPERFWRVKPFYDEAKQGIQTLESLIAEDTELKEQITKWRADPFNPYAIARLRYVAFMKSVVMRVIDNLIAWADQLFRRGTIESINEATQLYILAAQILGKRPDLIPARAKAKLQTFRTLDDKNLLDSLSNAIVEIESFLPPSTAPVQGSGTQGGMPLPMPFFCITGNDTLLGYWDTVADRLFKIRNCMDIEGVVRTLPMFDSPIDPGLLVRAAAAGVDLASALSDINAPLPHYRFNVMVQKATELCNDVRSLGSSLLAALEKRDAEALALLRSTHEIKLLNAVRMVKQQQVDEANETLDALQKGKEVTTLRRDYYRDIAFMNDWETVNAVLAGSALALQALESLALLLAGGLHLVPNVKIGAPTTSGGTYGGENVGQAGEAFGLSLGKVAMVLNSGASMAAMLGSHHRRFDDWKLQERVANKELEQIDKQIAAANIRKAIAEKDLSNHDLQIDDAREVDEYLHEKFTNRQLYDWMVGQISSIYFQSYQLSYDVAKRAERAYRYELGLRDSNFIQFGYWDSLKKGLLCGERLHQDLKRLEVSYLDQNRREYEITKHISLSTLDPLSLLKLKETGDCFVSLPEALFDIDYPGHYMRRVRSVGITMPCVTGPYAGVNCTLTQQSSSIRHANTLLAGAYGRQADDTRFSDSFGSTQSIVTSSGQNDSGLFEANMRDERYLPFEGQGAISTWRIQLPTKFESFDYATISDVVLHLRYSARDGGGLLKQHATDGLETAVNEFVQREGQQGLARVFSLRHEFPTEWYRFLSAVDTAEATLEFSLKQDRFPFQFRGRTIQIKSADIFLKFKDITDAAVFQQDTNDPTPLGDYMHQGSNVIELYLKPPNTTAITVQLNSSVSFLNGLPHDVKDFVNDFGGPKNVGDWSLRLKDVDSEPSPLSLWYKLTGVDHWRLKPDVIEDIFIACRYSI